MTVGAVSWNKIITVCSAFGIPMVSVVVMIAVWGTRLDDKLSTVQSTQVKQGQDIEDIRGEIKGLHKQVDTIAQRQHDADFIYEKKVSSYARPAHTGLRYYTEKWVDGKLMLIPYAK